MPPIATSQVSGGWELTNKGLLLGHAKYGEKLPHAKFRKRNDFVKLRVFTWLTAVAEGDMLRGQRAVWRLGL